MNLRHLIFFKELARTQHMSQAAENLGISQPSLSYAIKKLEDELGVPLFEPDGRNIKLTQLGDLYLKYVTACLNDLSQGNDLISQLMDPNQGHVNFGFTYTMGQQLVPELVTNFKGQTNNHEITFTMGQSNSGHLLQDLDDEKYDVVIASHVAKLGEQDTENRFEFIPIVQQEIMGAVPADSDLARKDQLTVADLAAYPMIIFSKNSGLRPLIDQILQTAKVDPQILYEVEEDHTMAGFVQYGLGVALMPYLPLLDQSHIRLRHLADNQLNHQMYMVVKQNRFMTPSVHRFVEFVRSYCWQHYTNAGKMI